MGLFGKIFGSSNKNNEKPDFSFIADIARLISPDDVQLMEKIEQMLSNSGKYFNENAGRYDERFLDVRETDTDTLMWIGLADELSEHGYLYSVDWKCEAGDFKWALSQLKSGDVIPDIGLDESKDVVEWGALINGKLPEHCICWVDIDSDSYELIIVTNKAYDKVSKIAESNGHRIVKF